MSNHTHAYGWSGHILARAGVVASDSAHNVIAIDPEIFERIDKHRGDCDLDRRIKAEVLGVEDAVQRKPSDDSSPSKPLKKREPLVPRTSDRPTAPSNTAKR